MIKLLSLSIFFMIGHECHPSDIRYSSTCGQPPKPLIGDYTQSIFRNKTYSCDTHLYVSQTIKCNTDGQWSKPWPRCGKPIDNDVIQVDINGQIFVINQTENSHDFPINFAKIRFRQRVSTSNVQGSNSEFNWTIKLTNETDVAFLRLDLASSALIGRQKVDQKLIVSDVYVGDDRDCVQIANQPYSGWTNADGSSATRHDIFFDCDQKNSSSILSFAVKELSFKTRYVGDVDLAGVFVTPSPTNCGQPSIPLFAKLISTGLNKWQIICDDNATDGKVNVSSDVYFDSNCRFHGDLPKCVPKIRCKPIESIETSIMSIVYRNTLYGNESIRYLIENTTALVTCRQSADQVKSRLQPRSSNRICLNSDWLSDGVVCSDRVKYKDDTETSSPIVTIILVIVVCLCLIAIIGLVIFARRVVTSNTLEHRLRGESVRRHQLSHSRSKGHGDRADDSDYEQVRYSSGFPRSSVTYESPDYEAIYEDIPLDQCSTDGDYLEVTTGHRPTTYIYDDIQ